MAFVRPKDKRDGELHPQKLPADVDAFRSLWLNARQGFLTTNEARKIFGLAPVPDGDDPAYVNSRPLGPPSWMPSSTEEQELSEARRIAAQLVEDGRALSSEEIASNPGLRIALGIDDPSSPYWVPPTMPGASVSVIETMHRLIASFDQSVLAVAGLGAAAAFASPLLRAQVAAAVEMERRQIEHEVLYGRQDGTSPSGVIYGSAPDVTNHDDPNTSGVQIVKVKRYGTSPLHERAIDRDSPLANIRGRDLRRRFRAK